MLIFNFPCSESVLDLRKKFPPEIFSKYDPPERGPMIIWKLREAQLRPLSDTPCICPSNEKEGWWKEHCLGRGRIPHTPVPDKTTVLQTSQWKKMNESMNEVITPHACLNPTITWMWAVFTDTQGTSQTCALKIDFQNRPQRYQRTNLAGIINHLGKENLNRRDRATDKRGILYGKQLDMGVKHPYHRWQENKSCCQQQFAGKGRLRRMEQESWDTHGKVSQVEGDFIPPRPGPSEPREGDTLENLKAAMVTWLKPKWQEGLQRAQTERSCLSECSRVAWKTGMAE